MTLEEKIQQYRPSEQAVESIQKTPILLIASVVAGGKNTVIDALVRRGGYQRFITNTTRDPRLNEGVMERDDEDYHFMSREQAESLVDERAFVEVKYVHGNVYGSTLAEFEKISVTGTVAVGDIDVQGVEEYLKINPDVHAIFLLPPSVDSWLARLTKRYGNLSDHADELIKRFKTAYDEITFVQHDPRFILVINDDLETTVKRVHDIVEGKEHETSDYAEAVTEHLLQYLNHKLRDVA